MLLQAMARILQHGQNKAEGVKKVYRLALKVWNAQTMGRILQYGQNKAEGVKKVHRLALKVGNASKNHGLHHSARTEQG
jgi:hypothetical protein